MVAQPTVTRVAVVGYGYWGSKHVRVLSSIPDVAVTGVDGHPDRLAQASAQFPNAFLASDLEAVLDDIDAVLIATPPGSHPALARHARQAGKHVLVEKPLTTSVEDAEMLVDPAGAHAPQSGADDGRGGRLFLPHCLHVVTTWRVGRSLRRAVATLRRAQQQRRTERSAAPSGTPRVTSPQCAPPAADLTPTSGDVL